MHQRQRREVPCRQVNVIIDIGIGVVSAMHQTPLGGFHSPGIFHSESFRVYFLVALAFECHGRCTNTDRVDSLVAKRRAHVHPFLLSVPLLRSCQIN